MSHSFSSASLETLKQRAVLTSVVRRLFESHGYWEVSTPLLSNDICVDQWLEPFSLALNGEQAFLQTSPEFAMKRLLCRGADAIYEITKSFRQDELGDRHNPEFTILEWYRCGDDHHAQMNFVEDLLRELSQHEVCSNAAALPETAFERITYRDAFQRFANCDPLMDSFEQLLEIANRHNLKIGEVNDRDQILNELLAEVVEPILAQIPAVFLYDYPASQAALAIVREDDSPVAERFELYLHGVEICNGYHELTDPVELKKRMCEQNIKRSQAGLPELPVDSQLLTAMQSGMPPSAGVALGLDRLIMHCLGKQSISEVLAFPIDRA